MQFHYVGPYYIGTTTRYMGPTKGWMNLVPGYDYDMSPDSVPYMGHDFQNQGARSYGLQSTSTSTPVGGSSALNSALANAGSLSYFQGLPNAGSQTLSQLQALMSYLQGLVSSGYNSTYYNGGGVTAPGVIPGGGGDAPPSPSDNPTF